MTEQRKCAHNMPNRKVRAGRKYIFRPVLLDRIDARTDLQDGDVVEVVNLPGCPRAGTMGHCHVYKNGRFAGLVCDAHFVEVAPATGEGGAQ